MEDQETKLPAEVVWKAGKKTSILPVGADGCRVEVSEYYAKVDGKRVPIGMTLRSMKGVGR